MEYLITREPDSDYIEHYGVKGQKWGIRRFQKYNGVLTVNGKKRYTEIFNAQKTKHRINLEKKYMSNGMSKKEAGNAANKRIKAEKYVAAAGGMTVAACAAYCAYRHIAVDRTISNTTDFQRIMRLNNREAIAPGRAYVSYKKKDNMLYSGKLADDFRRKNSMPNMFGPAKDIQKITLNFDENIKVASPKRARTTFAKMYKENPEFRKAVNTVNKEMGEYASWEPHKKLYDSVKKESNMKKSKLLTKGYDAFNVGLADNSEAGKKMSNMFYAEMRKQGINAIQDLNDKKYSGYHAKDPLIVFKGTYQHSGKTMSNDEILANYKKAQSYIDHMNTIDVTKKAIAKGSAFTAATLAAGNAGIKSQTSNKKKRKKRGR